MTKLWASLLAAFTLLGFTGQATFAAAPPEPNKVIVVSLSRETLTAWQDNKAVLTTLVTTGGPGTRTPTGVFHVLAKRHDFYMTSPWPADDWRWYAPSWVNEALLFDWGGYFIHDASWRHQFGPGSNAQWGTPGGDTTGTHGCVNVPLAAERFLYDWASIGTPVVVQP